VLCYILLSGFPPFNGETDAEIMKKVRAGKYSFDAKHWNSISDSAKDFIRQMLTFDQDRRPTAEQLLLHPWIADQINTVDESVCISSLDNLKNFKAGVAMKQSTYAFIASQLVTKQERYRLAKVFKSMDKNGDGKLSMDEVKEGYADHYGRLISDKEV